MDADLPRPDRNGSYLLWDRREQLAGYGAIERIFPTRTIRAGDAVQPLPLSPDPLQLEWVHEGRHMTVQRFMAEAEVAGLIIIRNGRIRFEGYGLGHTSEGRWTSFSVAKSLSSTLVGAALRDGFIRSIDDPVDAYVAELSGSVYQGVSIRQLLTMTSGVDWNEDYADPASDVARIRAEPATPGGDPVVSYLRRLTRSARPGERWRYSTGETHLVGSVIRAATGRTLSEYASEKIWRPAGMEADAFWMLDAGGNEYAGCCISARLRDVARFAAYVMAQEGTDSRLTPAGWMREAVRPTSAALSAGAGYGYQWWTTPSDAYQAVGIFGQLVHIEPALDLIVVIQSAWPTASDRRRAAARAAFIGAVQSELGAEDAD